MQTAKQTFALTMSMLLVFSPLSSIGDIHAAEDDEMINIADDSAWQGSVFGNNGGQNGINSENFEIIENDDYTVTLRSSNDKGKIESNAEGLAYYFQDVPEEGNFELKATAKVESFDANNQVSFGLMLRSNVLDNENQGDFTGDYLSVGALDQTMKGFYNLESLSSVEKDGYEFESANAPAGGEEFELSVERNGDLYSISIGDETKTVEDFDGAIEYAGLYTTRNTEVTYSDISFGKDEKVELGDWNFSAFGSNTGESSNPDPLMEDDGSVTLTAEGGKIESQSEGISYFFNELPADANFEITTTANVRSFNGGDSQASFGLMLRDAVGENGDTSTQSANYAASGALDGEMKSFYKIGDDSVSKNDAFANNNVPAANEEYELSIQKSGDTYVMSSNGEQQTLTQEEMFSDEVFAGFYAARDAEVNFSDYEIEVETNEVSELEVDASNMKTDYLIDEDLDTEGLNVNAVYSDGSEEELADDDYIVTGFDSSEAGTNTITINYNGVSETIDLTISELSVTDLDIQYLPAKTSYYQGDAFDPEGLTVIADYNDGYQSSELSSEDYTISIDGEEIEEGDTFSDAGTKTVTVTAIDNPDVSASFKVEVAEAELTGLYIRQAPEKTTYFLGDELDLDGIVVYAQYSDDSEVRLVRSDFEASELDTSEPGEDQVTITHKGESSSFDVVVKEKEVTGLEVTTYPQTTYDLDEEFSTEGLEVSEVYDNGDEEVLSSDEYSVDSSAYDSSAVGTYEITITPESENLEPVSYNVSVRDAVESDWAAINFGQSAGSESNSVEEQEDGSVRLIAEGPSGGKITGDHDGISYYYTEIDAEEDNFELSADIQVNEYAKDPHDGQESFGIMARDAIGEQDETSVFASNIAAIGGFSGGTTEENGTQLFARTGVESSDGAGSQGIQKIMLDDAKPTADNTHPNEEYNLTLSKTNSGYTGTLNNGTEEIIYEPDILNVQDDKIYVGFYTARVADIEVSNIDFNVTAAGTDPPKVDPPSEPVEPDFEVQSLSNTSETENYEVMVRSNVNGEVNLKQGQENIAQQEEMEAGTIKTIETNLEENKDTNFSAVFLPDDTQNLTSFDQIVTNFTVTNRTFDGDIYVSPDGTSSGDGSEEDPVDLDTAVHYVGKGQDILLLDGDYVRDSMLMIEQFNDGSEDALKTLKAAPGAAPVIDFDKQSEGVELSGDYWHVEGIDFARSAGNTKGFVIGGSNNIVENSRFYEHGDTGLQISRTDEEEEEREEWPSDNLVLNSTSFDNRDPSDNNADGFAAKLTSGEGNVFRGTIAHNNIDDGWDLYTKVGTGEIGSVLIEDSIAYDNGFLTDGTEGSGDKNGFKLGGEGVHVPHVIRSSIAFNNGAYGFTSNSNPGVIAEDNVSFNNAGGNLNFSTYSDIEEDFELSEFVSYQKDYEESDSYPEELESDSNYLFDGSVSANQSGVELNDDNFASLEPELPYERDENGDIIWGDFLEFIAPDDSTPPDEDEEEEGTVRLDDDAYDQEKKTNNNGVKRVVRSVIAERLQEVLDAEDAVNLVILEVDHEEGERGRVKLTEESIAFIQEKNPEARIRIEFPSSSMEMYISELSKDRLSDELSLKNPDRTAEVRFSSNVSNAKRNNGQLKSNKLNAESPVMSFRVTAHAGMKNAVLTTFDRHITNSITSETELDENKASVVRLENRGNRFTAVPTIVEGDTAFFKTQSLSRYVIVENDPKFKDVPNDFWAKEYFDKLGSRFIFQGREDGTVAPNEEMKRAQFAALLTRALGLKAKGEYDGEFKDVGSDDWFTEEIQPAIEQGIIQGRRDGTFAPNESVTRQQAAAMLSRAMEITGFDDNKLNEELSAQSFEDADRIGDWAIDDVERLLQAGIIDGREDGRIFDPLAGTTRGQMAKMLDEYLTFVDFSN
ncbi:bacterial Ig-like domain-containing protein [Alteribacillus sp. HJP-4]|uniref:bacterial Ig-like domain-containing protein n=1 Tax=Alteribacillus sp. HJP-4 TaxID=2775394 RepID=UPI0035CCD759